MLRNLFLSMLLMVGVAVLALPAFNTATGYVQLPNAEVLPLGVTAAIAYERTGGTNSLGQLNSLGVICDGDLINGRVQVGLGKFELGAGYLTITKDYGDAQALEVSGKMRVLTVPVANVVISLGAAYRQWTSDLHPAIPPDDELLIKLPNVTTAYVAVDKRWDSPVTGGWHVVTTVGGSLDWYTGAQQALESGSTTFVVPAGLPISASGKVDSAQFFQPFAGVEAGNGTWSILAEYRPELEKDGFIYNSAVMSLAVRKKLATGLFATVGVTNYNIPYTDSDLGVFADLGFHFGL